MKNVLVSLLLMSVFLVINAYAESNYLEGKVVIDKNREFKDKWQIKEGTTIKIKEGVSCIFSGTVSINGKKDKPVVITGEKNAVLSFNKCPEVNIKYANISNLEMTEFNESSVRISNADLFNNKIALKFAKNSNGTISNSTIKNNQIGFISELKAKAGITGVSFVGNEKAVITSQGGIVELKNSELKKNQIGYYVNNEARNTLTKNQFIENEAALVLHQNSATEVTDNAFFKNKIALHAEVMSNVAIIGNKFVDNETGVNFIQYVGGIIRGNNFLNNKSALKLEKKCSPEVRNNTFKENENAVYCDFSSYPIITLNNFLDNKMHIKLGIYQSADFENRVGSLHLQVNEAMAQQTKRISDFNKQRKFYVGEIYAKKNYWDEKTIKEMESKENISSIYDGFDLPETKYEGFGEGSYKLDIVVFKPFLKQPVTNK